MSVDANCVVNIVLLSAPDCEDAQVFSFQQPSVGIGHQGDKGERIVMVVRTNLISKILSIITEKWSGVES